MSQDLEPSEEDQQLALKMEVESAEVLAEKCPDEFAAIKEEDVSSLTLFWWACIRVALSLLFSGGGVGGSSGWHK